MAVNEAQDIEHINGRNISEYRVLIKHSSKPSKYQVDIWWRSIKTIYVTSISRG